MVSTINRIGTRSSIITIFEHALPRSTAPHNTKTFTTKKTAINNIVNWLKINGMKLSIPKTKYIIFYRNIFKRHLNISNITLNIDGTQIVEPEKSIKYVGYWLTYNLSPLE
eukprot:405374_1